MPHATLAIHSVVLRDNGSITPAFWTVGRYVRVIDKVSLEETPCLSVGSLWGMRPAVLLNSFQTLLFHSLTDVMYMGVRRWNV